MFEELPKKEEIRTELKGCWTGPIEEKDYNKGPIPPEEWPYGSPSHHQKAVFYLKGVHTVIAKPVLARKTTRNKSEL